MTNGSPVRRAAIIALQAGARLLAWIEVDAVAAHDLGDAARVPPEADRVLRGRREELQFRARVAQPLHQPAALAQDDGAAARALDRLGDLDGRKLGPSGIELGDDLQYGRALFGQEAVSGGARSCLE